MSKKQYLVADGVTHVNGAPVPENRKVTLTDAEALYERAVGRVSPIQAKPRKRRAKPKDDA